MSSSDTSTKVAVQLKERGTLVGSFTSKGTEYKDETNFKVGQELSYCIKHLKGMPF